MSLFRLISKKVQKDLSSAEEGLISKLMNLDFETAEEYQLDEYDTTLTQLSSQLAAAAVDKEKEVKEWNLAVARKTALIADATKMDAKINDGSLAPEQVAKFEAHLTKLLDEIEGLESKIEEEKAEADAATEHFNMLKEAVDAAAKKLANARKTLGNKKKELDRLAIEENRMKDREKQQQVLLGLKAQTDNFGKVTDVLDKKIAEKRQAIATKQLKMDALKAHVVPEAGEVDADIAAVLGTAPAVEKRSLKDRMASLK